MEKQTINSVSTSIDKAMNEIRRINCKNVGDFDPFCFMIQLENGGLYLEVKYRIAWFRIAFTNGVIETEIVRVDNDGVLFKATVYKEPGVMLANGYGHERLDSKYDSFACAETRAIGRALAQAGFGTVFCGNELSEGNEPCDAGVKSKPIADKPTVKLESPKQSPSVSVQEDNLQQKKTVEEYIKELTQETALKVECTTRTALGKQIGELLKDKAGIRIILNGASDNWSPEKEATKRYKAACIVIKPVAERILEEISTAEKTA